MGKRYVDKDSGHNGEIIASVLNAAESVRKHEINVTKVSMESSIMGTPNQVVSFDLEHGDSITMIYYPKGKDAT